MTFVIKKEKTWKGLSYVLKSSVLKNEIIARGLDCYIYLNYWTPQMNNETAWPLIEAEYLLPNANVDHSRFHIRTGVVPSAERKNAEIILINEVLPRLIEWMTKKINQPVNSTDTEWRFSAFYKDRKVVS
jgi:hypothetical protein